MQLTKKHVRICILFLALLAVMYFFWLVRSGLYPFIIALLLAYLLNPAVCYLEGKGLSRGLAIILLYVALFSILLFGGARLVPIILRDLESFAGELPHILQKSEELFYLIQSHYQNSSLPYSMRVAIDDTILSIQREGQLFARELANGIMGLISHFIGIAITPILAFYFLHDWREIKDKFQLFVPGRWRQEFALALKDIDKVLNGVIRGQITIAVIVGILVSSGLYYFKVPFALLIGIAAGLLDVIPYFGAFIGATPAITLALLESPLLAMKVAVLFFVIHQLEGSIISPKILGENVGLHPLTVIFFLFAGGELFGIIGMLVGVPIAAVGKVLVKHSIKLLV
ncbi:AI-2E family transporter [Sporomusa acidovorans]|uniref:Transport protein YhhT n=1 Tax=Sporomusa acidovorans (strain ATCC 49682 / DSM 3132 / Mol) TaxID=1123286 RepID=A0ABZ3J497_SPOA4|nr:AI-2E family transporter [Sporomusa acidovorans]OZC20863.1 AI-2 transport protein TqsA [Sporomusa acidovorans DSM 3132]SDE59524.1 Predicted PurR-regulated permease PerM [Sporomusa acidovorans]